ncbi:MAG: phosphoadenylyl-sulfate reductase [Alphaproteobacteria bacterium]
MNLEQANKDLTPLSASERILWGLEHIKGNHALTSSFGIQSAVMLHLVTQVRPNLPIILIDTGYLFTETYQFIDALTERLKLNLKVYSTALSPAWQEARYGKQWCDGLDGLSQYNQRVKVEPLKRAASELGLHCWFSGIRRSQSQSRHNTPFINHQNGLYKIHPIVDWSDKDIYDYLQQYDLPYHPLWEKNYLSVGDWHSSAPITADMTEEETRFFGLKRECGIHEDWESDGSGI